ncbi:sensor histidine kinase [Azospira restricta]|uniref:Histidine kinase n=1 Tax=Azospira restricta TaxID=404405 RepID=A0A974SR87_9RHOO|nr:histidine kinase [Azospira restricta]QRJ65041.1 histidine kinase [Azospira restricta]
MASIKQNPAGHRLPDFRNLGVMLRVLLGVNLIALAAALALAPDLLGWLPRYVELAVWVEPLLLASLLLLALLRDLLWRLPYAAAVALVLLLVMLQAVLLQDFWRFMGFADGGWPTLLRGALLAAAAAAAMLGYFFLRAGALSPAVAEARMQALTARIRPHFLFNSLNAALSLIRSEPRRAEQALEELAELFRALMRDHRELVPLADEVALCRQYLDLEKLRLGERLQVDWAIEALPELLVPPLLLQPLLENAVYHGIEPSTVPGTIRIRLARRGDELAIELENPVSAGGAHPAGNRMALANIRERLALYYDLEARLEVKEDGGSYKVQMVLPCRN